MDYGILIAGIVGASIGGAIVSAIMKHYSDKRAAALRQIITRAVSGRHAAEDALFHLRRNAFLTNEHGHRVRYHKASAEVRARAEAE